jgi:hypothetical protein
LEVDRGAVWSRGLWEFLPYGDDYTQGSGAVKFEGKLVGRYPNDIGSFENRFEANALLTDKFAVGTFPALGTLADSADGRYVTSVKAYLIAINSKTARFIGEAQSRRLAAVDVVTRVLDDF